MSPKDIIRLDLAIEVVKLEKNKTFKEIFKNYIMLMDFEEGTNKFKQITHY